MEPEDETVASRPTVLVVCEGIVSIALCSCYDYTVVLFSSLTSNIVRMSSNSSLSTGLVSANAFTIFNDRRKAHEIEANAIKEGLALIDRVKYDGLLNQMAVAQVVLGEEDQAFFADTGAQIEALELRAEAETTQWKGYLDAYVAARANSGTLVYLPSPLDTLGIHYWINDDRNPVQLTGSSMAEIGKNKDRSLFASRAMAPFQKSRAIGSDYKLRIEVMKSALREGHSAIRFSSLKSSGSSYILKVGQKRDARRSISAVLKLADCPVCTIEELFLMWVGAAEHNEFKTSFLDFLRITDMKDLYNVLVYRDELGAWWGGGLG